MSVRGLHSSIILYASIILCLPGVTLAGGSSGRIPSRIASAYGPDSDPVWISAESVVDREGKLALDSLPLGIRLFAERQLQSGDYKKYGCLGWGPSVFDRAGPIIPHSTFKEIAQNSKSSLRGTVTDVVYGFSVFGPSSLLEIRVDEWLKRSDKTAARSYIYLVYPVAEFEVGGYRFCKKETPQWGGEPRAGDEILLFPYQSPVDDVGQVFLPDPDDYEVILKRQGQSIISAPKSLKDDPDLLGVKDLVTLRKRALEHIQKAGGTASSSGDTRLP
jgi:hypothetical protein